MSAREELTGIPLLELGEQIRYIIEEFIGQNEACCPNFKVVANGSITLGKVHPIAVENNNVEDITVDTHACHLVFIVDFPHEYIFTIKEYKGLYGIPEERWESYDEYSNIRPHVTRISVYDPNNSMKASIIVDGISSSGGVVALPVLSPFKLPPIPRDHLDPHTLQHRKSTSKLWVPSYTLWASHIYRENDTYTVITSTIINHENLVDAYVGVHSSRELADALTLSGPRPCEMRFEYMFVRDVDPTIAMNFLYRNILSRLQFLHGIYL